MPLPREIRSLLKHFAMEIERWSAEGEIPSDFFVTTDYNRNSEQHSKTLGMLSHAAYKGGYLAQIERGLFRLEQKRYRFTPDIVLRKKWKT